jgi:hypothetical protein
MKKNIMLKIGTTIKSWLLKSFFFKHGLFTKPLTGQKLPPGPPELLTIKARKFSKSSSLKGKNTTS